MKSARFSGAFIASKSGEHTLCFKNKGPETIRVAFEYKVGAQSEDYSDLATKEHLEPIEVSFS